MIESLRRFYILNVDLADAARFIYKSYEKRRWILEKYYEIRQAFGIFINWLIFLPGI